MLSLLASFVGLSGVPANAVYSCTGVPEIRVAQGVDVPTHSMTMALEGSVIHGTSVTTIHNGGKGPVSTSITIPFNGRARAGNAPTVTVRATLNKTAFLPKTTRGPIDLTDEPSEWDRSESKTVMIPAGTTVLRVEFWQPLGFAGMDNQLKLAAYRFGGDLPIRQLNATFKYGRKAIFGLPEFSPKWNWTAGDQGAFLRINDYSSKAENEVISFYLSGYGR